MGNNTPDNNNQSYVERNDEIIDGILSTTSGDLREYIQMIGEWANENNLQVIVDNPTYDFDRDGRYYSTTATVSVYDPESGLTISVFESGFKGTDFDRWFDSDYEPLNKNQMNLLLSTLRSVDSEYIARAGITNVNIDSMYPFGVESRPGTLGYFTYLRPNSIQIPLCQLFSPNSNGSGIRGTIVHECAHAYDNNVFGKIGSDSIFTTYKGIGDEFPTMYAKDHYNDTDLPMWHRKSEIISTVVEQVESKTLRHDALMRNGKPATNYEDWAKDWKELVDEAEHILKG